MLAAEVLVPGVRFSPCGAAWPGWHTGYRRVQGICFHLLSKMLLYQVLLMWKEKREEKVQFYFAKLFSSFPTGKRKSVVHTDGEDSCVCATRESCSGPHRPRCVGQPRSTRHLPLSHDQPGKCYSPVNIWLIVTKNGKSSPHYSYLKETSSTQLSCYTSHSSGITKTNYEKLLYSSQHDRPLVGWLYSFTNKHFTLINFVTFASVRPFSRLLND